MGQRLGVPVDDHRKDRPDETTPALDPPGAAAGRRASQRRRCLLLGYGVLQGRLCRLQTLTAGDRRAAPQEQPDNLIYRAEKWTHANNMARPISVIHANVSAVWWSAGSGIGWSRAPDRIRIDA